MKKYILFIIYHYYPSGGIHDIDSFWDSIEEAQVAIQRDKKANGKVAGRNYEVVDRDTLELVHKDKI